jgi:putative transposase
VNDKRVERLWRREGLKAPSKQPKRGRLWLNDGLCVRLRPQYRDHAWSYDFVHHETDEGRAFRTLNIIDEYPRECLAIRVKCRFISTNVTDTLTDGFTLRGIAAYIRSDNGPEFAAQATRNWIKAVVPRLPIPHRDHRGKTGAANPSNQASGMNCSTEKSSTA